MTELVKVAVVTITPEMATKLLARNVYNRGVRKGRVTQYAADLRNGDWQLNGESIKIDWDGRILDGQHRLLSVIEADRPMRTVLITGLDPKSQESMDQGLARTTCDALRLRGEGNPNTLAAAARIVFIYLRDGKTFTGGRPTPTIGQVLRTLERCPEIRESVNLAQRLDNPLVTRSLMAALHYLFACVDQAVADEFMRRLAFGGEGHAGELHLRLKMDRERDQVQHSRVKGVLIVLAWNAAYEGRPFEARVPDEFPAIAGFHGSFREAARGEPSSQATPRAAPSPGFARGGVVPAAAVDAARAALEAAG